MDNIHEIDYPKITKILPKAVSTLKDGIQMQYQRWSTTTAALLAWNPTRTTLLFRSAKNNHFILRELPRDKKDYSIEQITEHQARVFFENKNTETHLLQSEAFLESKVVNA